MLRPVASLAGFLLWVLPMAAGGQGVQACLSPLEVTVNGVALVIAQDQDAMVSLTGVGVPVSGLNDCIQPITAAPGVATFGPVEVLGFLQDKAAAGGGMLLDVRLPKGFAGGHLPGAVNLPFVTLSAPDPLRAEILKAIGVAVSDDGTLDFAAAPSLVLYGDGPFSNDAVQAVQSLLEAGYPAEKLIYYRGGLQEWLLFGLTTAGPNDQG